MLLTIEWKILSKDEAAKHEDIPMNKLSTVEGKGI